LKVTSFSTVREAISKFRRGAAKPPGLVAGSLFLCAEALEVLRGDSFGEGSLG
jgi:hypothetical protein